MDSSGAHVKDDLIDTRHGCILYIEEVTVSFDGFKALNDLNLFVDDGELLCIIGPNGAGKTTMMDVITGKTRPDKGTVFFGQNLDLTQMTEFEISHAGIGRKFQKPTVFLNHTVFENLELALHTNKGIWQSLTKPLNGEQRETIEEDLDTIGLKDQKDLRAGLLSHGQKQWLEIGMLLAQNPRL
jgi:urea transport system ATP-binding protein